jgi:hypothetical protein
MPGPDGVVVDVGDPVVLDPPPAVFGVEDDADVDVVVDDLLVGTAGDPSLEQAATPLPKTAPRASRTSSRRTMA